MERRTRLQGRQVSPRTQNVFTGRSQREAAQRASPMRRLPRLQRSPQPSRTMTPLTSPSLPNMSSPALSQQSISPIPFNLPGTPTYSNVSDSPGPAVMSPTMTPGKVLEGEAQEEGLTVKEVRGIISKMKKEVRGPAYSRRLKAANKYQILREQFNAVQRGCRALRDLDDVFSMMKTPDRVRRYGGVRVPFRLRSPRPLRQHQTSSEDRSRSPYVPPSPGEVPEATPFIDVRPPQTEMEERVMRLLLEYLPDVYARHYFKKYTQIAGDTDRDKIIKFLKLFDRHAESYPNIASLHARLLALSDDARFAVPAPVVRPPSTDHVVPGGRRRRQDTMEDLEARNQNLKYLARQRLRRAGLPRELLPKTLIYMRDHELDNIIALFKTEYEAVKRDLIEKGVEPTEAIMLEILLAML